MAEALSEAVESYIGQLYQNLGLTYYARGDFYEALTYYNRALELAIAHNETLVLAALEASLAEIAQAQGQYLRALTLLHGALEKVEIDSPFKAERMRWLKGITDSMDVSLSELR